MARKATVLAVVLLCLGVTALLSGAAGADNHLNNSVPIDGEVPIKASDGPTVTLVGPMEVNLTDFTPATDTVRVRSTEGNITVSGADGAEVTVDEINGTWTNTSSLDVIGNPITINPDDKESVDVGGDITDFNWRQGMAPDDGTADFEYSSSLGSSSLTLRGLPSDTELGAVDRDSNTILDVATTNGDGNVTFSGLDDGSHTVELVTSQGGPIVDDSSASPTGGLSDFDATLSIDVSDPDFPTGDEVTVNWHLDGEQVATETITENTTVTHSVSDLVGGEHTWNITTTDAYGGTTSSQDFTVEVPSNVTVREEAEPHDVIREATVVVLISGSDNTVDRQETTTGNISLDGLPVDERYIVVVNADGYHQRAIYVPDIFDQSSVFLLNESEQPVQNTITVQDNTGQYDSPVLNIEKPVNRSLYSDDAPENYQWTTIAGDRLGASGSLTVDLRKESRYRFTVRNQEGDTRVLGEYTADLNGTITLTIGDITWNAPTGQGYQIEAYQEETDGPGEEITIQYEDTDNSTSQFCVEVHEAGNASNVLYPEDCAADIGTYKATIPVTGDDRNTSWVANWSATIDGEEHGSTIVLSRISEFPVPVDGRWVSSIVYVLLIGGLAATPKASARTGALLVTVMAFGLTWWGWVVIPTPTIAMAGAIALLGKAADFNSQYP